MIKKQRHKRAANRRKQRQQPRTSATTAEVATNTYWLTPAVHSRRCEVCGHQGSIAYRHFDQSSLCELCIERLGVVPLESKAWKRATRRQGDLRAA